MKNNSDIGNLPYDWEMIRLGDACINITDGSHFSPKDDKKGDYRIGTVANMTENRIDIDSCKKISKQDYEMLVKNGCKPKKGDVLFSKDGTVGLSFPFKQRDDIVLLSSIAIISPKENLDSDYCACVLKSPFVFKQIEGSKRGTGLRRIILHDLNRFQIPLPPLPEQRRIAEVLGTVDNAIQKVGGAIERTERLKKGLMQRLLTKGIGYERFKFSQELGCEIPEEWTVVKMGDIVDDFVGGGTPSTTNPDYWNGKIAWMTSSHISGRVVNSGQRLITEKGLKESSTHLIPKGNLLVATRVGIGKAAINSIDVAISQDLTGVIINKDKLSADYIYWFLLINLNKLKSLAQGSTIKGILKDDLANLKVPLPPLPEQRRVAEILSAIDRKLELESRRKEKLERVKKGLMNDLLTGRKRIKMEETRNVKKR